MCFWWKAARLIQLFHLISWELGNRPETKLWERTGRVLGVLSAILPRPQPQLKVGAQKSAQGRSPPLETPTQGISG
jgi:hypothetical protein